MKLNLKWDGLTFDDSIKGQKGEVRAASIDIEMSVEEMVEMAKSDRELILGLIGLGKDYLLQKKQNEEKSEHQLKKMAIEAFEAIKPKVKPAQEKPTKIVDDGELY